MNAKKRNKATANKVTLWKKLRVNRNVTGITMGKSNKSFKTPLVGLKKASII